MALPLFTINIDSTVWIIQIFLLGLEKFSTITETMVTMWVIVVVFDL